MLLCMFLVKRTVCTIQVCVSIVDTFDKREVLVPLKQFPTYSKKKLKHGISFVALFVVAKVQER